jgi:hypothetical protein
MPLTPSQRRIRAQIAAHTSWANTADPAKRTAPARKGFLGRFERQVDPEGKLPLEERQRRAESAMRAHMQRLALKSARARSAEAA